MRTREWETVEYAADAVAQGLNKALIVIGHVASEQGGMEECTHWLSGFVKSVPLEFVAAKEPFWTVGDKGRNVSAKVKTAKHRSVTIEPFRN